MRNMMKLSSLTFVVLASLITCGSPKQQKSDEIGSALSASAGACRADQWEAHYYYDDENQSVWKRPEAMPWGAAYFECVNSDFQLGPNGDHGFIKNYYTGPAFWGRADFFTVVYVKRNAYFNAPNANYSIYNIRAHFDDAIKFYVDDALMASAQGTSNNNYTNLQTTTYIADGYHDIAIKFNEYTGGAHLNLLWTPIAGGPGSVNPTPGPVVPPPPTPGPIAPPPPVPNPGAGPGSDFGPTPNGCKVTSKVRVCVKPQSYSDGVGVGPDAVSVYSLNDPDNRSSEADWRNRGFVELTYKWNYCENPNGEDFAVQRYIAKPWSQSGQPPYSWSHPNHYGRAETRFNSLRVYKAAANTGGIYDLSAYLQDGLGCDYYIRGQYE